MTADPRYVAARRVLLDSLEALSDHMDAVVLAGAQAVYLRTGGADLGVAEYTTDGDLVVDPDRLADVPPLGDAMRTRFEPMKGPGGAVSPGSSVRTVEIEGNDVDIPIDLIVPEGVAPLGGSRGARLGPHGKRAARKAAGLEAVIVDNDVLTISAVDPDDGRRIDCRVAGPTALLLPRTTRSRTGLTTTLVPTG